MNEFITPEKVWDTAKLSQVLPQHLVKHVLAVPIPMTNMEDSFCWGFTGSGDFTTKSATWRAHDNIKPDQESWKFNWMLCLKLGFFYGSFVIMHSPHGLLFYVKVSTLILYARLVSQKLRTSIIYLLDVIW